MPARAALWVGSALLCRIELIELHGADGQTYFVNTHEISSLRQPTKSDLTHYFAGHVRCIVVTTNGKFLAAAESCNAIRDRLASGEH